MFKLRRFSNMEAKLPNINASFIYYRSQSVKAYTLRDYNMSALSLHNMNALLTEEYRIEINDKKYYEKIKEHTLFICNKCKSEIPDEQVSIKTVELPFLEQVLCQVSQHNVWICPECDNHNPQIDSDKKKLKREQPFYLKVIPNCPQKKANDIRTRSGFDGRFASWMANFSEELEHQIALYRQEYTRQHGEDMDEGDTFKDDGKD